VFVRCSVDNYPNGREEKKQGCCEKYFGGWRKGDGGAFWGRRRQGTSAVVDGKPNSVAGPIKSARRRPFLWCVRCRTTQAAYPSALGRGAAVAVPLDRADLFGLAAGGVCLAVRVTPDAVRSYRTISPLPAGDESGRRYLFCCTFRRLGPLDALAGRAAGCSALTLSSTGPARDPEFLAPENGHAVRTFLGDPVGFEARPDRRGRHFGHGLIALYTIDSGESAVYSGGKSFEKNGSWIVVGGK